MLIIFVSFQNGSVHVSANSNFSQLLEISASNNIVVGARLNAYETVKLIADSDCSWNKSGGAIMINGMIDSSHNHTDITLWGGSLDIALNSTIYAGLGSIIISERCHENTSLAIGGDVEGDYQRMAISTAELNTLFAKNITFDSYLGSVWSYGLLHPAVDMFGVTGTVLITALSAGKRLTFDRNISTFRELFAEAKGGIMVHENITTVDGQLSLAWDTDDLTLNRDVTLSAHGGDLRLISDYSNINAAFPGRMESTTHNFILSKDLNITRFEDS